MGAIKKDSEYERPEVESSKYYVYKRWVDMDKRLVVEVNLGGEFVSDCDFGQWDGAIELLGEADADVYSAFYKLSLYVPVPFCKGDILTNGNNEPFVLTDEVWAYGEKHCPDGRQYLAGGSIMDSIHGYAMSEDGDVYWDFNPATLDLEYYRGELNGLNRVLKAISSHMKGEISIDLLMNAYDIILHEEQRDELRGSLWFYTNKGLALVGLEKEKTRRLPYEHKSTEKNDDH